MTWKIRDGIRCRRQAQYDNTKVWRESRVILKREGVFVLMNSSGAKRRHTASVYFLRHDEVR